MELAIPVPLKAEHDELHARLRQATQAGGRTAEAAREVARLLHPHFVKEEEYAMPQLGLLAALARGEAVPARVAAAAMAMSDRLRADLPEMLAEHGRIVGALDGLSKAAAAEGQAEVAHFAEALQQHARTEEEVLYPAAILVGEVLRQRAKAA